MSPRAASKTTKQRKPSVVHPVPAMPTRGSASVPAHLKRLDRTQRHAVLATASNNRPHASLVAFALTPDYHGLLFATPKTTAKYRNIVRNGCVSLVIDNRENSKEDYLGAEAITIFGKAREVQRKKMRTEMASILTRKHPALKQFVDASTTALMLVKIERCLHVGRFQTVTEWRG